MTEEEAVDIEVLNQKLELAAKYGKQLLEENNALKAANAELKRLLEETVDYDQNFEISRLKEREKELMLEISVLQKSIAELDAKCALATNEVQLANIRLTEMQQKYQAAEMELSAAKRKLAIQEENLRVADSAVEQLTQLTSELTQTKQREMELEKENQELRRRLAEKTTATKATASPDSTEIEKELAQLRLERQTLMKELQQKTLRIEQLEATNTQLEGVVSQLGELRDAVEALKEENEFLKQQIERKDKMLKQTLSSPKLTMPSTPTRQPKSLKDELAGSNSSSQTEDTEPVADKPPPTPNPPQTPTMLTQSVERSAIDAELLDTVKNLREQLEATTRELKQQQEFAERISKQVPETITIPTQERELTKEGWLIKQGAIVKSWKRRWFYVESSSLFYCTDVKEKFSPQGAIVLKDAKIDTDVLIPNKRNCFAIKTPSRTYFLCADTPEEKMEWTAFLKKKIAQVNNQPPPQPTKSSVQPFDGVL